MKCSKKKKIKEIIMLKAFLSFFLFFQKRRKKCFKIVWYFLLKTKIIITKIFILFSPFKNFLNFLHTLSHSMYDPSLESMNFILFPTKHDIFQETTYKSLLSPSKGDRIIINKKNKIYMKTREIPENNMNKTK